MGLAMGTDGALYISDYKKGRIWRVVYTGEKASVTGNEAGQGNNARPQTAETTPVLSGGAKLFQQSECATCHTVGKNTPASTGPSLHGLYGSEVTVQNGEKLKADEAYLRESILKPNEKIVAGYMPVMPAYEGRLKEDEVNQLVSYMKSLR